MLAAGNVKSVGAEVVSDVGLGAAASTARGCKFKGVARPGATLGCLANGPPSDSDISSSIVRFRAYCFPASYCTVNVSEMD